MEERAADMAAAAAGRTEAAALRVGQIEKGVVGTGLRQRGVVELVAAQAATQASQPPDRRVKYEFEITIAAEV